MQRHRQRNIPDRFEVGGASGRERRSGELTRFGTPRRLPASCRHDLADSPPEAPPTLLDTATLLSWRSFTVAALLLLTLFSCTGGNDADGRARIALVLKTLNNPFFVDMQAGAEEASKRLNVNLTVQAAERELDVEKQMQILENLIQTRVDAICVTPSGSKEIIPAIAKANDADIPVLILDTRIDAEQALAAGVRIETFIGSDNYEGGRIAGQYLADLFNGRAKVAVLEGIPGHETGDSRLRGFHDGIKGTGIEVVASQPANWERDQGFNVFQNLLQAHQQIDGLFACSDLMALGAVEAIAAAGRSGQIKVVGFDALQEARQAIEAGTMEASIAQFPAEMGRLAVESALRVLKEEKLPESIPVEIELIGRGKK